MASRLLGVISPLREELADLWDRPDDAPRGIGGFPFWHGEIAGREAVFVQSGPGKVNAGVAAALLMEQFACRALLLCGVAGGLDPALGIGDVVVGLDNIQHDFGLSREEGFETIQAGSRPSLGQDGTPGFKLADPVVLRLRQAVANVELEPLPKEIDPGQRRPSVHFGHILTGDSFVSHEALRKRLHAAFRAQAVEMEGGAVAQMAHRWGEDIPFVNVRCLSDLAGAKSHLDFRVFLPVASRYAAQVARLLAPVI